MIDWATVVVPVPHTRADLDSGMVLTIAPDGSIERGFERSTRLRGSFEASVTVKSHNPDDPWRGFAPSGDAVHQYRETDRHWLWIDGNPSKWRWGHNLFGTDDPMLIYHWVLDVLAALGLPRPDFRALERTRVNRIDVTRSFRLESDEDVSRWLRAAELSASVKYRGRGNLVKGSTLYFGQHSRHWSLKAYGKSKELSQHPLPTDLPHRDDLIAWARGIVRIECRYMAQFLRRQGFCYLDDFSPESVSRLWSQSMENVNFNSSQTSQLPPDVPSPVQATYFQWLAGVDLLSTLPRSTWYRHRRALLALGIDISIPPSRGLDVPSLAAELVARPARAPSFATDSVFALAA